MAQCCRCFAIKATRNALIPLLADWQMQIIGSSIFRLSVELSFE
jgi:hypothetical protein